MVLIRKVHSYIVHTVFHHPQLLNKLFTTHTWRRYNRWAAGGTRPAGRGGDNFLASQGLRAQFNGGEKSGSNNDEESGVVWQGR